MRTLPAALAVALLLSSGLAACGQKGALYMPDAQDARASEPAGPDPERAEAERKKKAERKDDAGQPPAR